MSKTTWYLIFFLLVLVVIIYAIKSFMKQTLLKPLDGPVTSKFGPRAAPVAGASTFHNGVDIAPKTPTTAVIAPLDGVVYSLFSSQMGGLSMIIRHEVAPGQFWLTGYADLSAYAPNLKKGDKVKQGQVIGYPGASGPSTGTHLHFTLTNPKGEKVNPEAYFNKPLVALG